MPSLNWFSQPWAMLAALPPLALAAVVEMPFSVRAQSASKGANTWPSFSSTVSK